MQRSHFLLGMIVLLTTGCNNSSTAGADKDTKTTEQKAAAVMLTDISTSKEVKTLLAQTGKIRMMHRRPHFRVVAVHLKCLTGVFHFFYRWYRSAGSQG